MSYTANAQRLETASERIIELVQQLTHAAETGRDSYEYAAKVSVLAQKFALASTGFCEAVSTVHCDNLAITDETSCENADDFADWAKRVAHSRSYAPFEGVRGPTLRTVSAVDLRPLLAAE